mmetsp:Transcript_17614/g.30859  ORF Transcript_17614/g.30859 Transcript_17614/m.30859 type:complete len:146 (-) Transcript_17614:25-462(-)|eukprot:CAMPEP_0197685468 /NCGR_PEP_ID=MMETSP1338-20131121/100976_1 /TAXON_ID=43686 ORGANISM="Pelagodinium beii, Strain RCC1491" /NCGR_SAMPLE_ID=MMETSP1338 /ASSEMBLY_ACC=CAM_ASM_000754 /LENGTH=145 /DNA_ID=CAMNT_0043267289 /DNA_START=34 /DNA_END=468 /DNA_ORIENTATION=-
MAAGLSDTSGMSSNSPAAISSPQRSPKPSPAFSPKKMDALTPKKMDHRKHFKEGQKHLTPPVADATRAFYVSLLKENPESANAIRFCIEHGVLALEEHKKLLKKYSTLKEKGAFSDKEKIKRAIEKKQRKLRGLRGETRPIKKLS